MKQFLRHSFLLPLAAFVFASCSFLYSPDADASLSFVIDKATVQKIQGGGIHSTSRSARSLSEEEADGLYFELSLIGDYTETKTVPLGEDATITFENIPVGARVYARAEAYKTEAGKRLVFYTGTSEQITIQSGENQIALAMRKSDDREAWSLRMYVSASADADTADGTEEHPFASIAGAVAKMTDATADYTIIVDGTLAAAQTIPATASAKSVTIVGAAGEGTDGIKDPSSSSNYIALSVSARVPVTVKNLAVAYQKFALSVAEGASLTLDSGTTFSSTYTDTINAASSSTVEVAGSLTMNEDAKITLNNHYYATMSVTGSLTMNGTSLITGGKAAASDAVLNIKGGTMVMNDNAGITNSEGLDGGVEITSNGSLTMNGNSYIAGCKGTSASLSSGVYVNSGSFTMNGNAAVVGNTATNGYSAVMVKSGSTFTMNGGFISGNYSNKATVLGAGIYNEGTFVMKGGSIGGTVTVNRTEYGANTYKTNIKGSGLYMVSASTTSVTCSFTISGDAKFENGSDIYLASNVLDLGGTVAIDGALTQSHVAKIVTEDFADGSKTGVGKTVLSLASEAGITLDSVYNKFTVPIDYQNGTNVICKVGSDGTVTAAKDAGDIIFTDGTAVGYSATLSLTGAQKAKAAAVIFYRGTDCSNADNSGNKEPRTLGVGLKQTTSLAWCTASANAYSKNITTIQCYYSNSSWQGDLDGSDNFAQIGAFLSDNNSTNDTSTAANYPAFNWANSYASSATNLAGTAYESGWYIPTLVELHKLYTNAAKVSASLTLCGGATFSSSQASQPSDNYYWSSSQSENANYATSVKAYNFFGATYSDLGKSYSTGANPSKYCAIRAF